MPRKKQRRNRGEGSFYVRKDGRHVWEGMVLGQPKMIYGKTRDDVMAKKDKLFGDLANGLPIIAGKETVGEFMVEWLASIRRGVRPKTYSSYESAARVHIIPTIGEIALTKLRPFDIEEKLLRPLESTAPRTCAYVLVVLRRAFGVAMKWERVRRNVAVLVDMPKYEKPDIHPYDDEEWDRYLAALEGHPYRALFLLGGVLGLRKGEACGLAESAIDFETGHIKIFQQVQRVGFDEKGQKVSGAESLQVLPVKTKKSRRVLRVGPEILAALKEQRRQQLEWRLKAGAYWNNEHGLLFTTRTGSPLDPKSVLDLHYEIVKKAGLRDDVSFHGLRHQAGTNMVASGMDLGKASTVLGHSSIRITGDIYVEPRMTEGDVATIDGNAMRRAAKE